MAASGNSTNQNGRIPATRQPLAFETHRLAGCPLAGLPDAVGAQWAGGPRRYLCRAGDEEFLERNGLTARLYKLVQRVQITPVFNDINSGIEKKTREYEDF
jgi:hypothetical protein